VEKDTPFKAEAEKLLTQFQSKETESVSQKRKEIEFKKVVKEFPKKEVKPKKESPAILKQQEETSLRQAMKKQRETAQKDSIKRSGSNQVEKSELSFFAKYKKWILITGSVVGTILIVVAALGGFSKAVPKPFQGKDDLYGYKLKGKVVIEPHFGFAGKFINGKATVATRNFKYAIDVNGDCIENCPPLYRYGFGGKYGVISSSGKKVTEQIYNDVGFYGGGYIAVLKDDKWGYVDENGKESIPLEYDEVSYFYGFMDGKSWVRVGSEKYFIDEYGMRISNDKSEADLSNKSLDYNEENQIINERSERISESPHSTKPITKEDEDSIFIIVEEMPRFPGCENEEDENTKSLCSNKKLSEFISNNIIYPEIARSNNIEGTVYISFVVEMNGSISNHTIVKEIGGGCGSEALRVINMMPIWIPGNNDGKAVRVQLSLPIKFEFEKGNIENKIKPLKKLIIYSVQVTTSVNKSEVNEIKSKLQKLGYIDVFIVQNSATSTNLSHYKINVGKFLSETEAEKLRIELRNKGFRDAFVKKNP